MEGHVVETLQPQTQEGPATGEGGQPAETIQTLCMLRGALCKATEALLTPLPPPSRATTSLVCGLWLGHSPHSSCSSDRSICYECLPSDAG